MLATSALFGWCVRLRAGGKSRQAGVDARRPNPKQLPPPTPKKTAAALPPTADLHNGGRSPYLLLDAASAAGRFLDWLDAAEVKTATAHETWLLYGEHCLSENLEQLPNNVIMAEMGRRVWRGQKRMPGGERPTVYAFDQPPPPPRRKLTLVERRKIGLCRPVQLKAA